MRKRIYHLPKKTLVEAYHKFDSESWQLFIGCKLLMCVMSSDDDLIEIAEVDIDSLLFKGNREHIQYFKSLGIPMDEYYEKTNNEKTKKELWKLFTNASISKSNGLTIWSINDYKLFWLNPETITFWYSKLFLDVFKKNHNLDDYSLEKLIESEILDSLCITDVVINPGN